jgi:hypothetical protein
LITVLDTNIVLDLWIFDDPRTQGLRHSLAQGHWRWDVCSCATSNYNLNISKFAYFINCIHFNIHNFDISSRNINHFTISHTLMRALAINLYC